MPFVRNRGSSAEDDGIFTRKVGFPAENDVLFVRFLGFPAEGCGCPAQDLLSSRGFVAKGSCSPFTKKLGRLL